MSAMDYDVLSPILNPMIAMEIMESPSSISVPNTETKSKRRKRKISGSASALHDQVKQEVPLRYDQLNQATSEKIPLNLLENFDRVDEKKKVEILWVMVQKLSLDSQWQLRCQIESAMRCNPVNILPYEISLYIFGFLDIKELARAARVSKQWNSLANDNALLKNKIKKGNVYCIHCNTHLGSEEQILSRKYRLDFSLAFNFQKIVNVDVGETSEAQFSTGNFTVAKITCKKCKSELGIKYACSFSLFVTKLQVDCLTPGNDYKKGTFLAKRKMLYFPGEPICDTSLVCQKCNFPVAKEHNIINWNLRLNGFDAYQITTMQHVLVGESKEAQYTTGKYTVAETSCKNCSEILGVKYLEAPSGQNAYKIGTYLIEKPKLKLSILQDKTEQLRSKPKEKRKSSLIGTIITYFSGRK